MKIPSPLGKKRARIEIIPLIDIVFFLLATFVMVSMSMVKHQGIPVQIPTARSAEPQDNRDHAAITIARDGSLFFNKTPVQPEELTHHLLTYQAESPNPRVFINGDSEARFGQAIAVFDQVRESGIRQVSIVTRPAPSSPDRP